MVHVRMSILSVFYVFSFSAKLNDLIQFYYLVYYIDHLAELSSNRSLYACLNFYLDLCLSSFLYQMGTFTSFRLSFHNQWTFLCKHGNYNKKSCSAFFFVASEIVSLCFVKPHSFIYYCKRNAIYIIVLLSSFTFFHWTLFHSLLHSVRRFHFHFTEH